MNITRETKLAELLREYPWLREEIVKVNEKFSMLNSPLGKVMEKKATIAEMSKKSGMDEDVLIEKISGTDPCAQLREEDVYEQV